MTGLANKNVQEITGKSRYNFKLRFIWGIPRNVEDAKKMERSVSAAVKNHIFSRINVVLISNVIRSNLMNLGSFTITGIISLLKD